MHGFINAERSSQRDWVRLGSSERASERASEQERERERERERCTIGHQKPKHLNPKTLNPQNLAENHAKQPPFDVCFCSSIGFVTREGKNAEGLEK